MWLWRREATGNIFLYCTSEHCNAHYNTHTLREYYVGHSSNWGTSDTNYVSEINTSHKNHSNSNNSVSIVATDNLKTRTEGTTETSCMSNAVKFNFVCCRAMGYFPIQKILRFVRKMRYLRINSEVKKLVFLHPHPSEGNNLATNYTFLGT